MFRFKLYSPVPKSSVICVSIHPMFRFKYLSGIQNAQNHISFNTSYVSVQVSKVYLDPRLKNRFNTSYVSVQEKENIFSKR